MKGYTKDKDWSIWKASLSAKKKVGQSNRKAGWSTKSIGRSDWDEYLEGERYWPRMRS